jgi:hypothetical protein
MPRRSARVAAAIDTLEKLLGDAEDMFTVREMNDLVDYIAGDFLTDAKQAEWDATLQAERARARR